MSKFVIECPNCGKFAEAKTGFFARKKSNVINKRRAKKDIKTLLGSQCVIDLWVKVKEDWKDRKDVLRTLGYSKDNY